MSFKLKAGKGLGKELRRVVVEDIDEALESLAHPARQGAVHDARKRVKRIRAVLRLASGALGKRAFARENQAFREIGGKLSPMRDAEVLMQAFDGIKGELMKSSPRSTVLLVGRHIADHRRTALARGLDAGQAVDQAGTALRQARARARQWTLHGKEWPALEPGFTRVYAQGRKRFEAALDDPVSDRFHAWRKRVKDLMYEVRLLRGLWPSVFKAWESDLDALAHLLGDDHDLAVLQATIDHDLRPALNMHDRSGLLRVLEHRRRRLEQDARPAGRRLFAERPKDVGKYIQAQWDAWRLARREEKS
jgi:CHAD domain-containing protein